MQISVVSLMAYLALVTCADLPDYFPRCYRNDDNLENCLIDASEKLKPFLKIGLPEFNIPSIDPLVLDVIDVAQLGADYEYTAHALNYTFGGLTNYTFEELRFYPDTLTLRGRVRCSPISIAGKIRVEGKVVVVSVYGDIEFEGVMGPIVTNFTLRGRLETRKNEEYFVPTKIKTSVSAEDIYFEKLVLLNDYSRMSELIKMMFNANSKVIMSKSEVVFGQISDAVVIGFLKKLTKEVPYNRILLVS